MGAATMVFRAVAPENVNIFAWFGLLVLFPVHLRSSCFATNALGRGDICGDRWAETRCTLRLTSRTVSSSARHVIVCSWSLGLLTVWRFFVVQIVITRWTWMDGPAEKPWRDQAGCE